MSNQQLRAQLRVLHARLRLQPRTRNVDEGTKRGHHEPHAVDCTCCNTKNKLVPRGSLDRCHLGAYINCRGLVLKGLVARDVVVDGLDAHFRDDTRAKD